MRQRIACREPAVAALPAAFSLGQLGTRAMAQPLNCKKNSRKKAAHLDFAISAKVHAQVGGAGRIRKAALTRTLQQRQRPVCISCDTPCGAVLPSCTG